jgi:hypothetical protein
LLLPILWTFVLIIDIISMAMGNSPDWIIVFCPLVILVILLWIDYFR